MDPDPHEVTPVSEHGHIPLQVSLHLYPALQEIFGQLGPSGSGASSTSSKKVRVPLGAPYCPNPLLTMGANIVVPQAFESLPSQSRILFSIRET